MENFFNYITKPLDPDDVDIWFKANNIIPEKLELFSDFSHSLNITIVDTFLGEELNSSETKITLTKEDNEKHFDWCWNKVIDNFKKEKIKFTKKGEHYDYFKQFFEDVFYEQKDDVVKKSVGSFFEDLFDLNKPFTKSDLDMIQAIYKCLDKNINRT